MHAADPVNRIMTRSVITIGPEESANALMRLFAAHAVHHIPVVEGRRVVGMGSSADMMKLEFFLPSSGAAHNAPLQDRWRAQTIMRSPAISVTEHQSVQSAMGGT